MVHKNVYESLQIKPKLSKSNAILKSVNRGQLNVLGSISLPFVLGWMRMNHTFIVASGINKNVILGIDWLSKFGVRLYFDLQKLRVGKTYVPLQLDIHIRAIVRLKDDLVMKPQTSYTCTGKMQNRKEFPPDSYEISQVAEGYVASEPEVLVSNNLVNVKKPRKLPLFIVNSTTKTICLKKNSIFAKAEKVQIYEINNSEESKSMSSDSKKYSNEQFL